MTVSAARPSLVCVLVVLGLPSVFAKLRFATTHGDGMVLPASPQQATVWGFCDEGDSSILLCVDELPCVQAEIRDSDNRMFFGVLPAIPASFSLHGVTAKSASGTSAKLEGVLFGSLWVCSGQSNMDFATPMVYNGSDAVQDANNYPYIRVFTVARASSAVPLSEAGLITQPWAPASNLTIGGPLPWTSSNFSGWEKHIGQVPGGEGFSAACWFFGRELYRRVNHPVGLIWSSYGGTHVETWMPPAARATCDHKSDGQRWNAMIAPLVRNVISGVVWYQGESNEGNPLGYNCTFPEMVRSWRSAWKNATGGVSPPLWPFGFVQLSTHGGDVGPYGQALWAHTYAGVRWAQTASYGFAPNPAMPNVFMASAVDIGEAHSPAGGPHVQDKQSVGLRLVLAYRQEVLQDKGLFAPGPLAESALAEGSKITIRFRNLPPGGFKSPLPSHIGFEVSSGNDSWVGAASVALVVDRTAVVVTTPKGLLASSVRYLWATNPCYPSAGQECPLHGTDKHALPALPFVLNITRAADSIVV